jgi:S1-C subfamily serine protease
LSRSTEALARDASPALVQIVTTAYVAAEGVVARASDLVTTQRASRPGVIVDPDGHIVTNAHMVTGAQRLHVDIPLSVTPACSGMALYSSAKFCGSAESLSLLR